MSKLIGTGPNQVPSNADLGTLAYQDSDYVNVGGLIVKESNDAESGLKWPFEVNLNSSAEWSGSYNLSNSGNIGPIAMYLNNDDTSITETEVSLLMSAGGAGSAQHQLTVKRTGTNTGDLIFLRRTSGGASAETLRIDTNGKVGIGASPMKDLDVVISGDNDFVTVGAKTMGTGSTNNWAGIHFGYRESNNDLYRKSAIVFQRTDLTSSNAQGKVHILNGPQSGSGSATLADAKLTIDEYGNVGIGTKSPVSPLEISRNSGNAEVELLRLSNDDDTFTNSETEQAVALSFALQAYEAGPRTSRLAAKIVARKGGAGTNDWYTTGGSTNFQGQLDFYTRQSDVLTKQMTLNEFGRLGIGTATPQEKLHVQDGVILSNVTDNWQQSSQKTNLFRAGTVSNNIDSDSTAIKVYPVITDTAGSSRLNKYWGGISFMHLDAEIWGDSYTGAHMWIGGYVENTPGQEYSGLVFATNSSTNNGSQPTERMRITKDGYVQSPYQPAFSSAKDGHMYETSGANRIENWTEKFDVGGHFDNTTGRFTAPVAGRYLFTLNAMHSGAMAGDSQWRIYKNGSNYQGSNQTNDGSSWNQCTIVAVIDLAVNDYVDPYAYSNNTNTSKYAVYAGTYSGWHGYFIG
jgi:hypothetical protein